MSAAQEKPDALLKDIAGSSLVDEIAKRVQEGSLDHTLFPQMADVYTTFSGQVQAAVQEKKDHELPRSDFIASIRKFGSMHVGPYDQKPVSFSRDIVRPIHPFDIPEEFTEAARAYDGRYGHQAVFLAVLQDPGNIPLLGDLRRKHFLTVTPKDETYMNKEGVTLNGTPFHYTFPYRRNPDFSGVRATEGYGTASVTMYPHAAQRFLARVQWDPLTVDAFLRESLHPTYRSYQNDNPIVDRVDSRELILVHFDRVNEEYVSRTDPETGNARSFEETVQAVSAAFAIDLKENEGGILERVPYLDENGLPIPLGKMDISLK